VFRYEPRKPNVEGEKWIQGGISKKQAELSEKMEAQAADDDFPVRYEALPCMHCSYHQRKNTSYLDPCDHSRWWIRAWNRRFGLIIFCFILTICVINWEPFLEIMDTSEVRWEVALWRLFIQKVFSGGLLSVAGNEL